MELASRDNTMYSGLVVVCSLLGENQVSILEGGRGIYETQDRFIFFFASEREE
jgi:hypothetical protein